MYYNNLKNMWGWLEKQPTKAGALSNANITGTAKVLVGSNNRALTIETDNAIYLQSYDTIVLRIENGKIIKFWNEYSQTTMKHINTFLTNNGFRALSKKEWLALETEKRGA